MYKCQYCNKELSSKSSLNNHLSKATYCISKRNSTEIISIKFKCDDCDKIFTSKQNFTIHESKCINKIHNNYKIQIEDKNFQIQEYKNQIQELQNKLENLAVKAINRPTTTNNTCNTNIMNLAPLDMDILMGRVTKIIDEKMTSSHLIDGQEGVARLIASCFINEDGKKLITCTDKSRGIWKSKDVYGNIVKDYKANTIANVVKPFAVSKADKIIELDDDKRSKLNELKEIKDRFEKFDGLNEKDVSHMKGHKKDSLTYKSMLEHMDKRRQQYLRDREREEEIGREYDFSSFFIDDEDADMKMRAGKVELKMMSVDSTKFSNGLLIRIK